MKIKPHKTKWPFSWIMELTFVLSRIIKNKPNNTIFTHTISKWPTSDEELMVFFQQWTYAFDPAHGIINMVAHPNTARFLVNGDCDDYAAKLYALAPFEEKYILTYFTHDLKKWHTVFVWYNEQTGKYNVINWSKHDKANHWYDLLNILKKDSRSPWYDYHLAYFDYKNNTWKSHK